MFFFFLDMEFDTVDRRKLQVLENIAEKLVQRHGRLSATAFRLFCFIAANQEAILSKEGITLQEMAERLEIPGGTIGRQLDLLENGYGNVAGLGLIERGLDPNAARARRVKLTEAGKKFATELTNVLSLFENDIHIKAQRDLRKQMYEDGISR